MAAIDPWAVACAVAGLLVLAVLALFAAFVVLMARRVLDMANTLAIVQKVDNLIDTRIAEVVERLRARDQRPKPAPAASSRQQTETPAAAAASALNEIFGQSALDYEQPDPHMETVGL